MKSKKVTVILNPGSGLHKQTGNPERVAAAFHAAGIHPVVHEVSEGALEGLVAGAAHDGSSAVVAGGGDGTVNAVAAALVGAKTNVPLGVLPLGTLNHFAKDVGIPLDLEGAVKTVADGETRTVDVAEVNGRYFVNNSSIGLYPRVVRGRESEQRLGRSKLFALAWAVLAVLRRFPTASVRLMADDGKVIRGRTPLVFVGNNPYEMRGLELGSRKSLDTGKLAVYFLHHEGARSLLRMGLEAIFGRVREGADFDFLLAEGIRIDLRRREVDVATDGEVTRLATPLIYRVHPAALRVMAPRRARP